MKWRNEYKYYVSDSDIFVLKHKLTQLLKSDVNANSRGSYTVSSLYFDDPFKSGVFNKLDGVKNTAYAINVVRNEGISNIDLMSKNITIPDRFLYDRVEKPWGYEELIECNDKYVVKKLFTLNVVESNS